jgi:mRNA-degrading endonuclease RelE of RelBE toxin-antitoxin system
VDKLIISAVRKILKLEESNIALKKLKGKYKGSFRIKKGDIRIIFSLMKEKYLTAFVKNIDFRGDVYK